MKKEKRQIRCYNSGQISGLPYLVAHENFRKADEEIKSLGLAPVNPMIQGLKSSRPWFMHVIADLCLMATCRHIFLQRNWGKSKGARIECKVARFLGMQLWFQENPGYEK